MAKKKKRTNHKPNPPKNNKATVKKEIGKEFVVASLSWRSVAGIIDLVFALVLYWPFAVISSLIFGSAWINILFGNLSGIILIIFLISVITINEIIFGRSLGKKAIGLDIVSMSGTSLKRKDTLVRNIFRIIDMIPFFIPYLVGLALSAAAKNNTRQRLGDAATKSLVISKNLARGDIIYVK